MDKLIFRNMLLNKEAHFSVNFNAEPSAMVKKSFEAIRAVISGNETDRVKPSLLTCSLANYTNNRGVRLFDIVSGSKRTSYNWLIESAIRVLDDDARINRSLAIIEDYGDFSFPPDVRAASNCIFEASDQLPGEKLIDFLREMLNYYPSLHVQTLKAAVLNAMSTPLGKPVAGFGRLLQLRALFSSSALVNLFIEGRMNDHEAESYDLYIPEGVGDIELKITTTTLFKPSMFTESPYLLGMVRATLPNLPCEMCAPVSVDQVGNVQKIVMRIDDLTLRSIHYHVPIRFVYYLLEGYNVVHLDDRLKFFSAISIEQKAEDVDNDQFYDDLIALNHVSTIE